MNSDEISAQQSIASPVPHLAPEVAIPATAFSEPTAEVASPLAEGFRDDDLGRLQRILVGDHVQQTNERLETLERALLGALGDLRESLETRLGAIEVRLDAENQTRTQAMAHISGQLTEEARIRARAQNLLRRDMDEGLEKTTRLIDELEARVELSVQEARGDLHTEVQQSVSSLESQTVSRSGLIKALLNAAEKMDEGRES